MLKTDKIDKGSWERDKYNDPYELKDDEFSNPDEQDSNLFSTFNLPQMCLSSVIDMYKNKPNVSNNESTNNPDRLKERLKNAERFSTARKLFENSTEDNTSEDYFNLESPVPAARTHIYKNLDSSKAHINQPSSSKCQPQSTTTTTTTNTSSSYLEESSPVVDLRNLSSNHHQDQQDEEEGIYYEQPWDLSNTQGNLEGHLQHFLKSAMPEKKASDAALSSSHVGDFRTQGNYEKPWDLRPEKKDDRGQEGYDQAWDLKPHNKDGRPCDDYDLPWDKNARQIERKFRASQKGVSKGAGKVAVESNRGKEWSSGKEGMDGGNGKKTKQPTGLSEYMNVEVKGRNGRVAKEVEVATRVDSSWGDDRLMSSSCLGIGSNPNDNYYNLQNVNKKGSATDDDSLSSKSRSLISLSSEAATSSYANQHIINKIRQKHPPVQLENPPKIHPIKAPERISGGKNDVKCEKKVEKKERKSDRKTRKEAGSQDEVRRSKPVPFSTFRLPSPPPQPPQMVRSVKQDDPRNEEEYDVPWDQKIKKLLARAKIEVSTKPVADAAKAHAVVRRSIHLPPPPPPSSTTPLPFDVKAPLESQGWYHGLISRTQAEDILRPHAEGSYLVRTSESNHCDYSLSVKSSKGFMHMKIVASKAANHNIQYILGQFSQPFSSIPQMVFHYSHSKLPIKGAEHISLLNPIAQEFL